MRIQFGWLCFTVVLISAAVAAADEPMFVRWLVMDDPGDETIRDYWQRAEGGELDAPALVDLGTMLFYRGYPKDAVRMYKRKFGADSDVCYVHPSALDGNGKLTKVDGVRVASLPTVLRHHFWAGQAD